MGPHASQLNKDERWKVAMYVRTMQFDGEINLEELISLLYPLKYFYKIKHKFFVDIQSSFK